MSSHFNITPSRDDFYPKIIETFNNSREIFRKIGTINESVCYVPNEARLG